VNLWIFNHYAVTPDMPGGTRHYDLARELVKRGHRVVIFATSFHHQLHREMRLQPEERWRIEDVDRVKFVWLRTPPYWRNDWRRVRNMVVFILRAWWLARKSSKLVPELGRPDVVIGSSPHLLTPLAAYWVARHYRAPFVMEVRDLWPQTIIDMGELSACHPITKALQILERFLYRRSERIITVLPLAHEYITACGISREKIIWIPNGVDISRFRDVKPLENDSHYFKIMYTGAHGQNDALEGLIRAARIVQDRGFSNVRFILVGDGPAKAGLVKLAKDLGLNNVEFRDPIQKHQVPGILVEANATILILYDLPLYKYGISANKIFDYLAASKPLILAGMPANNPVEEACCGLTIPPGDPEALAEAVIQLYQMSPEERAEMGKRGREYVEKHHDIRKLAVRLEEVLQSLVSAS